MGQSLSRRPAPAPTPAPMSAPAPASETPNNVHTARRSLPRRILSTLPKPSLRSRPLSSLTLPTQPEQTLRGKKRRWWPSRRHKATADSERAVPENMDALTEDDEHQVDRDVDEFGVITHRVPDSHSDSPAASAKGKERAKDSDIEDDIRDDEETPVASSSTPPPAEDHIDDDQVVIAPTIPPPPSCQPSPPLPQGSDHHFVPLPPPPTPPSLPQALLQQANTNPRPFPPPGTLVVVQGVVHTTDVPRSSERPLNTYNPVPPTTDDVSNLNHTASSEASSARPSSLPPGTRSRSPPSDVLPRPASMVPTVSLSPPSNSATDSSNNDYQGRPSSNASGAMEDSEDEDRTHTHPHGVSMAQGPVGASGLSASSIDVLGTLLSVAAAATAASLLTGSSEPIFSSGLTSSQPQPSSNAIPQPTGFDSNVPSERPLSPTPTSDAGRMRHVWSSLRGRLGLGSGAHNSTHSGSGPQSAPSQPSDFLRPRDPREIMLAEMARAFNLGLGLGGTGAPSAAVSANPNSAELPTPTPDDSDVLTEAGEQLPLPPPDSFERFLMDLQTDLRTTLMQEQESGPLDVNAGETLGDVEEDQPIPDLQSLSDSDSEDFETRHFDSDNDDEANCEDDVDGDGDEDEDEVHTAQEQLSGRTSPAVSALGTGVHSPFGVRSRPGSPFSFHASNSPPHTAPSQPISTAIFSDTDGEMSANYSATDNDKDGDATHVTQASSIHAEATDVKSSERRSEGQPEVLGEGVEAGVAHSPETSIRGRRVEAEGGPAISSTSAVPPLASCGASNVPVTENEQESFLGTSSLSTSNSPSLLTGGSTLTTHDSTQPSTSTLPSSEVQPNTQSLSATSPTTGDPPMPFRLPFTPSSASRTEHTPGGGINWWRMYRFPAIASPNPGQGPSGPSTLSQTSSRTAAQDPSHSSASPWLRPTNQSQRNETITPRETAQVSGVHSGLAVPPPTVLAATSTNMPEIVSIPNQSTSTSSPTNGQDSNPSTNTSIDLPEHRGNVVVPVIVVGLQSVNMDRQPPHIPHPHMNHTPGMDDEDGEGMEFDSLDQSMSMPLHIPEPPEFRHHSSPSSAQEQGNRQPSRGRTWQSRAANAIRNLRPSRRNADATSPQPQEPPGSRTFLIYVIGGYYPPDHQIITGGNLDSFEALWELAELLGQVKPPTVSKEEIEKSGLEIIKASTLDECEKQGRVASNCIDRCLICLDDYNPEDDLRVLTCKHTFHQTCVDRWLETGRNNCPACRTKGVGSENAESSTSATSSV